MAGSIQKRGENKYLLTVSDGFDEYGKRVRHTRTVAAKSESDARRQLALFYAEVMKGKVRNDKQTTISEYANYWIEKQSVKRAPKTISEYKKLMKRIDFALGHIRLSKLKPRHLSDFYDMLREDGVRMDGKPGGLSENTISHYHRLLRAMLETAYRMDRLISENPADSVIDPPTPGKPKPKFYDDEQTMELLKALGTAPIKYRAFIFITLFTGNRRGETLGLEWDDIDFDNNMIHIRRASQYTVEEGIYDTDTKTETSIRSVSVPAEVLYLIREYKAWQNEERLKMGNLWHDTNRLFTQEDGKPMHPDTVSSWFRNFLKENNLPHITIHGLRHTNASLLVANNTDIITIGERLGHADKATTSRIYAHMIRKTNEKAANALADTLLRNNENKDNFN